LIAAVLALQAPLAEVLAVVAQQTVTVFAEARARSTHHFCATEPGDGVDANPGLAPEREASKRNLLHRTSAESAYGGLVVNDESISHIDAVMAESTALRNQV
jgi:hypothetical protein